MLNNALYTSNSTIVFQNGIFHALHVYSFPLAFFTSLKRANQAQPHLQPYLVLEEYYPTGGQQVCQKKTHVTSSAAEVDKRCARLHQRENRRHDACQLLAFALQAALRHLSLPRIHVRREVGPGVAKKIFNVITWPGQR